MSNSLQPYGLWPARLLCPWNSTGKNTGVGSHSLLQGIFLTQELNPGLLHCRWILDQLSHKHLEYIGGGLVTKSCLTIVTPWTVACQVPLSIGFSGQEWWSGLPFPSPGDLPDPRIEPGSPTWQAGSLPSEPPGKPLSCAGRSVNDTCICFYLMQVCD